MLALLPLLLLLPAVAVVAVVVASLFLSNCAGWQRQSFSQSKSPTTDWSLYARAILSENCGCFLIFHSFYFFMHFVPVLHRLHVFVCELCRKLTCVCVCARAYMCVFAAAQTTKEFRRSTFRRFPALTQCRYSHCQNNKSNFFTKLLWKFYQTPLATLLYTQIGPKKKTRNTMALIRLAR